MDSKDLLDPINTISCFLAFPQIRSFQDLRTIWSASDNGGPNTQHPPVDVVVICASAVLYTAETVFATLKSYQNSQIHHAHQLVLVLCGGRGHSTQLLYDAVAAHPKYRVLTEQVSGLPEARVLEVIAKQFFGLKVTQNASLPTRTGSDSPLISVVVEDQSTNCGANASKTKEVLGRFGVGMPRTVVVCQDPTMCRRTVASFQHTYSSMGTQAPKFFSWPTFTPKVTSIQASLDDDLPNRHNNPPDTGLMFDDSLSDTTGPVEGLWAMSRFLDLILGEVPRLRNDESGYGPKGRGFIVAVDIPDDVEAAWKVVYGAVRGKSGESNVGSRAAVDHRPMQ